MAGRKIVYSFDVDMSKLSRKTKDVITELQKVGDFTKKDLGTIALSAKMNINKNQALTDVRQYKTQLENILSKIRTGQIKVDYNQLAFLNRELSKADNILRSNGGLLEGFSKLKTSLLGQMTAANLAASAIQKAFMYFKSGIVDGIQKAIDFNEANSKFGVVFRGVEKEANIMRDTLVTAYGMSRLEATKFLSEVQDILVPMGMSRDSAAQLSGEIVKLAADLGSFNNRATGDVIADIQSALVGNYETMKKYGVVLNDTILKEEARKRGLLKQIEAGDMAAKSQLAYQLIVKSSGDALGDFARTSDQTANQIKIFQANMANDWQKVVEKILPALNPLLLWTNKILDSEGALKRLTTELITIQGEYKSVLDKLAGSQENLTEKEKENLRVRETQIRLKIAEGVRDLNKLYDKLYASRAASPLEYMAGQRVNRGDIAELEKKIADSKKLVDLLYEIQKQTPGATEAFAKAYPDQGIPSAESASRVYAKQVENLENLRNQLAKSRGGIDDEIQKFAELYRNGIIDPKVFAGLKPELQALIIEAAKKLPDSTAADVKVAGQQVGQNVVSAVYAKLSTLERIQLRLNLKIINETEAESEMRAALKRIQSGALYKGGEQALRNGWALTEKQQGALNDALAIETQLKSIEEERVRVQQELTAAVEASKKTLAELDRESSNLFGTSVWDEFRKRLTGAIGAAVSLGEALNRAMDPDVEETNRKISELRLELEELYKLKDSGATETLDGKNLGDAITKKTLELTELSRVANETGKNLVAAYASVADEVSNMVKSYVSAYQDTMSELSDSIMDTSEKTRAAQSAAVKSTVVELEKQIPFIGWLLAMKSEAIPSYAEVVAEAQSRIQDAMNEYEHAISMGAQQSYSQQMAYYTTYISELKAMEASTEDIEAVEEKIAALKKEQTAQMQEQADLAKEIAGVGATLAGDATDQIAYWENVKSGAEKSMESGKDPTASVNAKNASLEAEIEKNTQLREFFVSQRDQWTSWLTPESRYKDQNQKIADVQAKIDSLNAQIAANNLQAAQYDADVFKYQTLIDEANTQLAVLKRTQLDESADTFEYDQTMSDATDTEKAADGLKYYSDYLEKMKALNVEYDALESDKYAELTALNEKLTMDLSEDEEKTINDQISALRDEIDALTDAEYSLDDIRDVEEKIKDLKEEQAKLAEEQTDEIKTQLGLLKDMNAIDLENFDVVDQIADQLAKSGLTGTEKYTAMSDIGVSNAAIAGGKAGVTVNIQTLSSTLNEASASDLAKSQAALIKGAIAHW